MKYNWLYFAFIFAGIFMISCGSESTVPKPRGYMKTNYPEKNYKKAESVCGYTFDIPEYGFLQDKPSPGDTCFKDLVFPYFNATIHFTYKSINADSVLAKYIDDSHNLAYDHVEKADDIQKKAVMDTSRKVYGIVYEIVGNAASQIQFFLTDSTNHFIRGAMYFNHRPNYDSLLPAINYLREDVDQLIKTFTWKNLE